MERIRQVNHRLLVSFKSPTVVTQLRIETIFQYNVGTNYEKCVCTFWILFLYPSIDSWHENNTMYEYKRPIQVYLRFIIFIYSLYDLCFGFNIISLILVLIS